MTRLRSFPAPGPGWIPAALVALGAALGVHLLAGVSLRDVILFALYVAVWLTLPGVLLWRLVGRRRGPRHIAEDLTLGTCVGVVLEFPAYLACLAIGHPHLYLFWPLVATAAFVATPTGRRCLRPTGLRMPARWSWATGGFMAYVSFWMCRQIWTRGPVNTEALRHGYVDEPFHLSLAVSLKQHFPAEIPYVDGTPLKYHWLSHLHVAASSWITGIEPIVLLRALSLPVLVPIAFLALALVANRLTNTRWTSHLVLGGLLLSTSLAGEWAWDDSLLSNRLLGSPSAGFVNIALVPGLLLCLELLRRQISGLDVWALTGLVFVAMLGAKSTSLPTFLAGLVGAAIVGSLTARRIDWRATGLAALSVGAFVIGGLIFFGAGSHGMAVSPLTLFDMEARVHPEIADASGHLSLAASASITLAYLLTYTLLAGFLLLLTRTGWMAADSVFLLGLVASGFGAGLLFHQSSFSEYYFVYVVLAPLLLGAVLGIHRVMDSSMHRRYGRPGLIAGGVGIAVGILSALMTSLLVGDLGKHREHGSGLSAVALLYVVPTAIALVLILAATVALRLRGRGSGLRTPRLWTFSLVAAGVGLVPLLHAIPDQVKDPFPAPVTIESSGSIGQGGIRAARWIRQHSAPSDVVATNAHCRVPRLTSPCDSRHFWMAAYSERSMLVEGWGYIDRTVLGLKPLPENVTTTTQDFWDQTLLRTNDAAFTDPTRARLGALRREHGVRWLLVDRRYPVNMVGLRHTADLRFRAGRYRVLEIR